MIAAAALLALALEQVGKPYTFGAEAKPGDPDPATFDCSELVEWVCARTGVQPRMPDGSWRQFEHAVKHGTGCPVAEAIKTPGALLFRFVGGNPLAGKRPEQAHVAISLGDGRTIEAKSRRDGVGIFEAHGRGWTDAARIPGVDHARQLDERPTFHPSVAGVLQYFDYRHLPPHLQERSKPFAALAMRMAIETPSSPELTTALRKVLEGKDAAVRAGKGGDAAAICEELRLALGM